VQSPFAAGGSGSAGDVSRPVVEQVRHPLLRPVRCMHHQVIQCAE
jgi:hypothetical protein